MGDGGEQNFSPDLKLFVGNLPFNVDSAELAGLFERAGNVEMVEVLLFYFIFLTNFVTFRLFCELNFWFLLTTVLRFKPTTFEKRNIASLGFIYFSF